MIELRVCLAVCLTTFAISASLADEKDPKPAAGPTKSSQADLEKAFAEKLSGAALVGRFTIVGRNDEKPPRPERYEIDSVTKLRDDYWVFVARVKYGNTDIKLPITVKVFWADDTPMVSLSNVTIPGLGYAFSTRVIFHGDRYAGTWQHGKAGGHMYGRIVKSDKAPTKDAKGDKAESQP